MDLLDELSKASRSVRVAIHNTTCKKLQLKSHPLISGQWKVQPPETILPLSTVEFGTESSSLLGGTEAGSVYHIEGQDFEFLWNKPYFGKMLFRRVPPAGFECDIRSTEANNCTLKFTIKEIDSGFLKETDVVETDIKTLNTYIAETEGTLKGITKMLQVYQAQNDTKQVKLVESQVREKTKHIEDMKLKKDSLAKEVETIKRLEGDPRFMEQNLSKIRESIDSSVKARKAMEHMREVYEKQKDLKSIEGLDTQIDVKKKETEMLRKKEQKAIQKIIELKKALGIGATMGVPKVRRAKALYNYDKTSEDELSIQIGDIIEIVNDENPEWVGGQLKGTMGFFPRSFVQFMDDPAPTTSATTNNTNSSGDASATSDANEDFTDLYPKARVIYEHVAADDGEITLALGDTITVYSWEDDYWWEGVMNGKSGYFPCTCVEWIEPDVAEVNYDDQSYSYYESTPGGETETPQPTTAAPTTTNTTTPAKSIPTGGSSLNVSKTNNLSTSPTTAPSTSPTNKVVVPVKEEPKKVEVKPVPPTPTPAPTPVVAQQQPPALPPKRELPTQPARSLPTAPTPTTTTTATNNSNTTTPTKTVSPALTPVAASSPVSASLPYNSQFDKLLEPLLKEFTKQLVDAHNKETAQLQQRIAQLEKEVKELRESGTSSPSTNSPTLQHQKPPSASPGTIKPAPTINSSGSFTSTATVISKASPIVKKVNPN